MSFKIEHFDSSTGLNLYAILFNSSNSAWKPSTQTFVAYSDATLTNFNLNLTEDINRLKYYTHNITGFATKDVYTVEIWRRIGVSPDKSADVLKAVGNLVYTGSGIVENIFMPKIVEGSWIGSPMIGDTLSFHINTLDKFGGLTNADEAFVCSIWDSNGIVTTATVNNLNPGWYYIDIPIDSGVYTEDHFYQIELTSSLNGVAIGSTRTFQVVSATAGGGGSDNSDVPHQLAYASGQILSATATSGYFTTLASSQNDHFNGGIMIVRDGVLRSEARIVRDYVGSTKFIQTQLGFTSTLTSGTAFFIMPIGGQLGLAT